MLVGGHVTLVVDLMPRGRVTSVCTTLIEGMVHILSLDETGQDWTRQTCLIQTWNNGDMLPYSDEDWQHCIHNFETFESPQKINAMGSLCYWDHGNAWGWSFENISIYHWEHGNMPLGTYIWESCWENGNIVQPSKNLVMWLWEHWRKTCIMYVHNGKFDQG